MKLFIEAFFGNNFSFSKKFIQSICFEIQTKHTIKKYQNIASISYFKNLSLFLYIGKLKNISKEMYLSDRRREIKNIFFE